MSLGDNIKKARIDMKLTQQELADAISTEENTYINTSVSNWENNINKPDPDTIAALCDVLNVDANFLLDFDSIKKEQQNLSRTELLFNKTKDILTDDDRATIEFIMNKRIQEYEQSKNQDE